MARETILPGTGSAINAVFLRLNLTSASRCFRDVGIRRWTPIGSKNHWTPSKKE